jgi:hypothetical protein
VSAVRTWFSVVVPVIDTPPVGASLVAAIAAVAVLVADSTVPPASV